MSDATMKGEDAYYSIYFTEDACRGFMALPRYLSLQIAMVLLSVGALSALAVAFLARYPNAVIWAVGLGASVGMVIAHTIAVRIDTRIREKAYRESGYQPWDDIF